MRRFHRMALLALLIGVGPAITGCADFDLDKLDVFGLNQKKPLPGERHAVFPEGVPGVTQGVPPDLMLGNAQTQPGAAIPIEAVKPEDEANKTDAAPPVEEKAKAKPKPKKVAQILRPKRSKQQQPASASAQPAAAPAASTAPAAQPASTQQAWPAPAQSNAPWPDPPSSGTSAKQ
jgi:hypothetical protein